MLWFRLGMYIINQWELMCCAGAMKLELVLPLTMIIGSHYKYF